MDDDVTSSSLAASTKAKLTGNKLFNSNVIRKMTLNNFARGEQSASRRGWPQA